ncbi:MAG: hypothetical protein U0163_16095 [Gemmatimonadaceae bacterium]
MQNYTRACGATTPEWRRHPASSYLDEITQRRLLDAATLEISS